MKKWRRLNPVGTHRRPKRTLSTGAPAPSADQLHHDLRAHPTATIPRAAATGRLAAQLSRAAARRVVRHSEADDRVLGEAMVAEFDALKGLAMKVGSPVAVILFGGLYALTGIAALGRIGLP